MQDFTDDFGAINSTDARHGVEDSVSLNSDLGPKVSEFVCHLGGPHIGTQRMKRDFSLREGVQALRELGARLAVLADDLAQVNPLRAGLLGDRLAFT